MNSTNFDAKKGEESTEQEEEVKPEPPRDETEQEEEVKPETPRDETQQEQSEHMKADL